MTHSMDLVLTAGQSNMCRLISRLYKVSQNKILQHENHDICVMNKYLYTKLLRLRYNDITTKMVY